MDIGYTVKITDKYNLFTGCEGVIVDKLEDKFLISLYKGNHRIKHSVTDCYLYLTEDHLNLI